MLKTAEEIFKGYRRQLDGSGYWCTEADFIKAINEARIAAIKECAELAKVSGHWYNGEFILYKPISVSKQSILNLLNEVK